MPWKTTPAIGRIMEIVSIIFKPNERDCSRFFQIMTLNEELPVFSVDTDKRKVFIGADMEVRGETSFYLPINFENNGLAKDEIPSVLVEKILKIKIDGKDAYISVWVDMK
ncbi:MAG: hypothetical protein V3W19_16645 [Desulfatiglandales bacterium]